MSNELADRLEDFIKQEPEADAFVLRRIDVLEAIAALRADSVAAVYEKADGSLAILPYHGKFPPVGTKLYAAPSRETAQSVGGARFPGFDNPRSLTDSYKSRETDQGCE